jgi:hypothetical protein
MELTLVARGTDYGAVSGRLGDIGVPTKDTEQITRAKPPSII